MDHVRTRVYMDYTADPVGLIIVGKLWTGQPVSSTATCMNCGRVGIISAPQGHRQTVVHTGHVDGNTLTGIDYCELGSDETHGDSEEEYDAARQLARPGV